MVFLWPIEGSLSSLGIYASPETVWSQIEKSFSGNFSDMVFDEDIPGEGEVVDALTLVAVQLKKLDC